MKQEQRIARIRELLQLSGSPRGLTNSAFEEICMLVNVGKKRGAAPIVERKPIPKDVCNNFEQAFTSGGGGCRRDCACGKVFYNPDRSWTWEDGEIESLETRGAIALDWTVSTIILDGIEYVVDCLCWHDRAGKVIAWINNHAGSVAEFLTREKKRKLEEANRSPVAA